MIWLIIFPIICFIVSLIVTSSSRSGYSYRAWERVGYAALWLVPGLFFGIIAATLIGLFIPSEERVTGQREIVSLADATHVEGEFYLFGGSVDSEPVYRYYYEDAGGFRMGWKPVVDSLIVESETETPRYDKIEDVRDTTWYGFGGNDATRYIFYVPPGTVTNEFNLDLEG